MAHLHQASSAHDAVDFCTARASPLVPFTFRDAQFVISLQANARGLSAVVATSTSLINFVLTHLLTVFFHNTLAPYDLILPCIFFHPSYIISTFVTLFHSFLVL